MGEQVDPSVLLAALPAPWRALVQAGLDTRGREALAGLVRFLEDERIAGHEVLPPASMRFRALELVEPAAVRVVILGQDPYPTPGHAHGLAFSYAGEGALPRSLRNILEERARDEALAPGGPPEAEATPSGDLSPWAAQGVLLLNTVLSVRAGEAGSHRGKGWEPLTQAILRGLAAQDAPVIFVLWGRVAERALPEVAAHHSVLIAGHPSPLSVRYFRGCGHFSAVNRILGQTDRGAPVDWGTEPRRMM